MIGAAARLLVRRYRMRRDPVAYSRSLGVRIGRDCRILGLTEATFGSEPYLVSLGDHVTVTAGVRFVTHDGGVWVFRRDHPDIDVVAPIHVGDNVFLGLEALVLPGVTIGDDCVIGARAVVTRDVPDGSVATGVPARVVSTTAEYWSKVQRRAIHVRSLTPVEKRAHLTSRFLSPVRAPGQRGT